MELGDRKKQILQAVIDDYIQTAEPVGSRTIAEKHSINLSPATIRNEMADLEDMGYLEKPHTSAGRIPSEAGYRFYVNSLMRECRLSLEETDILNNALKIRVSELDRLIAEVSDIVSRFTDYTVLASAPRAINPVIKNIKLLPLSEHSFLLAAMTSAGSVKNAGIEISESYTDDAVYRFSRALSDEVIGKSPYDLTDEALETLKDAARGCIMLYRPVILHLFDWFERESKRNVYSGGIVNIFNHPEYRDIEKAKRLIGFIGDRDNVSSIIEDNDGGKIKIKIGDENKHEELKDCSVVISNYGVGGNMMGSIGIVGPMRMNYSKIISALDLITKKLDFLIYGTFFDE